MANPFLKELIDVTKNEYASIVADGVVAGDVATYIDTGSYVLNAMLSGSIYGGVPSNKVTALAGPSATGKTFFLLGICKNFLDLNPKACVVYFESESALTKNIIEERGVDVNRFLIVPVSTIQEFRFQALKVLERYEQQDEQDRLPLVICLDSLGNLSTSKEMEDSLEGKETQDMTRARLIKGVFRILSLKLGMLKVPLLVTNHTYKEVGPMYPSDVMSGGSGIQYAASTIVFLSKRKEKDGTEVIGNIVHCKNIKNRFTKENKQVDVLLTYDRGLNRYYGLSELAILSGLFEKVSTRIQLPDSSKVFEKQLNNNPEKYYTKEILDKLDVAAKSIFLYGTPTSSEVAIDNKEEEENAES